MNGNEKQMLEGVAQTLLITLYIRALESQRSDALIKDENAVEFVRRMDAAFTEIRQLKIDDYDKATIVLRNREFDRYVLNHLSKYPNATVIHLGCGLDTRFERVDNGKVEWYDLDLPNVIDIRHRLLTNDCERYHTLPYSAFDTEWFDKVPISQTKTYLLLAEGVFMYFKESQIRTLVLALTKQFPSIELVFDAFSPFLVWVNNRKFERTKLGARYYWGLRNGKHLEKWDKRVKLVDEWHPFTNREPRLLKVSWMRYIPLLSRIMGIFHYNTVEP